MKGIAGLVALCIRVLSLGFMVEGLGSRGANMGLILDL